MSYADDPAKLATLLRNLADALVDSGVDPSGSSEERHLIDQARTAANELAPARRPSKGRAAGFA